MNHKKLMLNFLVILFLITGCNSELPDGVKLKYQALPETVDFNFHVRPILSDRCFHCHGPDENGRKADLRLDVRADVISKGHDKELFTIKPGKPWESNLIRRILTEKEEELMPPPDSKLYLTDEEKAILIKWIEQGAAYKEHWAYILPKKVALPKLKLNTWARNEIDFFVGEKLEKIGIEPSSEADKTTLIRRLTFDLIGLPPSLEDVAFFINDTTENAYEMLVDRLLASPRFGERWAWEWLDVARYSDTNGFQGDYSRDMWPWRDWVIQAFNDNMPYDDFTVKQLAGDLLPNPTKKDILATAFNRNHPYNTEGGSIPEETRVVNVFDRVETTGTVWLGLTLECARCHDHKFDAVSQKEYYQLFDYFNQTSEEGGVWMNKKIKPVLNICTPEKEKEIEQLENYLEGLYADIDKAELQVFPRELGLPSSESKIAKSTKNLNRRILSSSANNRSAGDYKSLLSYFNHWDDYASLLRKAIENTGKLQELDSEILRVMVMDEKEEARQTFVLNRGSYDGPLFDQEVFRNVPEVLPALPDGIKNNRLAFAQWLVSKEQPLTSRVTVNRYWQSFFGKGFVKTADDFGVQGALPTHPELLDWLSVDFQESGWDLKALFKKIVMSSTYRQSSKVHEKHLKLDPENKFLARATRMRLPSWMLRDQALALSGLMVDSLGGKPVKPYQPKGIWEDATFGKITYNQDHGDALYRRTLYTFWRRIVGPTVLFDNSTRLKTMVKPQLTNTPLHALTTLNDITYMEAARVLATNTIKSNAKDKDRILKMFTTVTSRKPIVAELEIFQDRLIQLQQEFRKKREEALKIATIGEFPMDESLDFIELASYTVLGSIMLNLDETITRQ
ncbi:PSD1 and planctomycete cytochrome C domain-containing protein [Sabulilitoribacter arenilitoris]|uniref:PSD1 and planctomycete cytochrome C domain-containing protein n=1 Tax=Wocania arenilitoris TaxID=2044858 RepID=A0AAE3JNE9_9FLAO|nr:PSD1 and planctomycete cytochrome C domain-containing protein [Wocania arenilitoris]MCF7567190.1 PSD1 and planctomycete cytochrome C domain-containing protein [Wocania arenilitoris]